MPDVAASPMCSRAERSPRQYCGRRSLLHDSAIPLRAAAQLLRFGRCHRQRCRAYPTRHQVVDACVTRYFLSLPHHYGAFVSGVTPVTSKLTSHKLRESSYFPRACCLRRTASIILSCSAATDPSPVDDCRWYRWRARLNCRRIISNACYYQIRCSVHGISRASNTASKAAFDRSAVSQTA